MNSNENTAVDGAAVRVPDLSAIRLPLYALKGALHCIGDEETRPYLQGVFLHSVEQSIRVVATDGRRMMVTSVDKADKTDIPDWLEEGLLIPGPDLWPRIGFLEKLKAGTATISYAKGAPRVIVSDVTGDVLFRLAPLQVAFPDYQRVIETSSGAFSREVAADLTPVGYAAGQLKDVSAIAKVLDCEHIRIYSSTDGAPSIITFDEAPGSVLYLMPVTVRDPMPAQTARLLDGPIKGTIAALRAHQTRWEQRLETAAEAERELIEEKVEEYKKRIAGVLAQLTPALPAPKNFSGAVTKETPPAEISLPETPEDIRKREEEERLETERQAEEQKRRQRIDRANQRVRLSGRKLKTAQAEFNRLVKEAVGKAVEYVTDTDWQFRNGRTVEDVAAEFIEEYRDEHDGEDPLAPIAANGHAEPQADAGAAEQEPSEEETIDEGRRERASARSGMSKTQTKKALAQFSGDVRAILSGFGIRAEQSTIAGYYVDGYTHEETATALIEAQKREDAAAAEVNQEPDEPAQGEEQNPDAEMGTQEAADEALAEAAE
jgi:hypothetical protein